MPEDTVTTSREGSSSADNESIARKIQFLVTTHRTTLQDLAGALNVRREILQEIIDGRAPPTPAILDAMAGHFGVTSDFFLDSEVRPRPEEEAQQESPAKKTTTRLRGKTRSISGVKALAVRHQALLEALISKGILSPADYHEHILQVEQRQDG